MLLRLSKNAHVRQYGPFSYVLERIRNADRIYTDAKVFLKWITRTPIEKTLIVARILEVYSDANREAIESDFEEFLGQLVEMGAVVCGESAKEMDGKDATFNYDVDSPKTVRATALPAESTDDAQTQDLLNQYFRYHPTIFTLQIDITQACTERCIHCYMPEYNPVYLELEHICRVIDEFAGQGGVTLGLSGGECMLHPDFDRIVRYARSKDLIVQVLSNLTLCDEAKIKLLKDAEATVQVSLYSMTPDVHDAITQSQGSFYKTKTAIEKLRQAQVPCFISCPTMKGNYKDYIAVLEYARSLKMDAQTDFIIMGKMDCDTSNLKCRLDLTETRALLEDIADRAVPVNSEYFDPHKKDLMETDDEFARHKVCGACVDSVCLDADGHYYPCPAFGGVNLGSCYEHDLNWIWTKSPETLRIRAVTGKDFPKCVHCKDRDYCSVCMCRNYNETGDMFKPAQHFCDVARINHEVVDEAQRRRNEGARS